MSMYNQKLLDPKQAVEIKSGELNDTRRAIATVDKFLDELDGADKPTAFRYRKTMMEFRQMMDLPPKIEKYDTITAFAEMRYELNQRAEGIRDEIRKIKAEIGM